MGFIETSYGGNVNLSNVNVDTYLNMDDRDIIGVKRFICEDYLGAVKATASDLLQFQVEIPSTLVGAYLTTKKLRIPSNIISGSTFKITANMRSYNGAVNQVCKWDQSTDTYSVIASFGVGAGDMYTNISANAGDIICIRTGNHASAEISAGYYYIKCDIVAMGDGAVWEVID